MRPDRLSTVSTLHCWETEHQGDYYKPKLVVCMLEDGHEGPHEWTDADAVMVEFKR
jgi:hypothetical protein